VPYRVELSKPALRQFEKLSKSVQTRLKPRIDALAHDPRPHGVKKLVGEDELYRLRVGDYRIIYQIQDKVLLVLVVRIRNRKEVYR
jgi:mRNA interferase RelE/StbE